MKKLILALILLLNPIGSLAHNILYLDADGIGSNNTVTWIATEAHSESASSGAYFDLGTGSGNTITVDMEGDNNGCCNYITGGFNSNSNSTLDISFDGTGVGHRVELDYDYSGLSTYHHLSVEISENYSLNKLYFDDGDADHSNTSFDLEIKGGASNLVYATVGGTRQTQKLYVNGGSNTIYSWTFGTGDYATAQTALASLDSGEYNSYIYITGSSNFVKSKVKNDSTTKIIITGDNNTVAEYTDRDDWLLNGEGTIYIDVNGDDNNIGAKIQGWPAGGYGASAITLDIDSDDTTIDVNQHGGGNTATIKVYGSSSYSFDLDVHQSQNHTFIMCFNRAHQSANYAGDFNSQSNHSETWNSSTIYSTGSAADCI